MNTLVALDRTIRLCRDYVDLSTPDADVLASFRSTRVLCIGDAYSLSTRAGQEALITLVTLLLRMAFDVDIDVPTFDTSGDDASPMGDLLAQLASLNRNAMPEVSLRQAVASEYDLVFCIGHPQVALPPLKLGWSLHGTEWSGRLGRLDEADTASWATTYPIGGLVSAALAAGEAFKFVMRRLSFRQESDREYFVASSNASFDFGEMGMPHKLAIRDVDFISAGAIVQSALYVLRSIPGLTLSGRVIDDDSTEWHNLNRNMLTMVPDVESRKVDIVSRCCEGRFELRPIVAKFDKALAPQIRLSPSVVIGVDHIPSRWYVQKSSPGWVAVGGTSHFNISSSEHAAGQACCGCLHPVDDPLSPRELPTVSFVSFWAGLATAVRVIRHAASVAYNNRRQHLWITPLRTDLPSSSIWLPVPKRPECPLGCARSSGILGSRSHRLDGSVGAL